MHQKILSQTVDKISQLLLVGALIYFLFILFYFVIKLFTKLSDSDSIQSLLHFFTFFDVILTPITKATSIIITLTTTTIYIILTYKSIKKHYTEEFEKQFAELFDQKQKGELQDFPFTPEMIKVQNEISKIEKTIFNKINILKINFCNKTTPEELHKIVKNNTKNELQCIELLKRKLIYLDIERRIEFDNFETTTPKGKISNFFFSEGFTTSLSKTADIITKISFTLFLLSLITLQTKTFSNNTINKLSISYLKANIQKNQELIDKKVGDHSSLTEEDELIINEIAVDFEIAVSYNQCWNSHDLSNDTSFLIKSYLVKEQILKSFVESEKTKNNNNNQYNNISIQKELSDDDNNIPPFYLACYHDYLSSDKKVKKPQTELGNSLKEYLKKIASQSETKWEIIKTNFETYRSSFKKPTTIKNIRSLMFSNIAADMLDGSNIGNKIASILGSDNIKLIGENISTSFLNDLVRNYDYLESLQKIQNMPAENIFGSNKMAIQVNEAIPKVSNKIVAEIAAMNPPALKMTPKPLPSRVLKNIAQLESQHMAEELLTSYEDFFPGQVGSDLRTEKAHYINRMSSEMEPLASNAYALSQRKLSFARARNVKMLRGFHRIGGVLIGEMPAGENSKLNLVDIKWENTIDNKLNIKLIDKEGNITDCGSFSKAVVKRSLLYAADGRPTTVTMVYVGVHPLKILLHPALVNSEIGTYAIDMDRFVDTYQTNEISKERDFLYFQSLLYSHLLSYLKLKEGYSYNKKSLIFQIEKDSIQKSFIKNILISCLKNRIDINSLTARIQKESLTSLNSVLVAKSIFFEQTIVHTLNSASGASFYNYITDAFNIIDQKRITLNNSLYLYQTWSGVREQNYQLNNLYRQGNSKNNVYPFNFIIQTAITQIEGREDEEKNKTMNINPWQFPMLEKKDLINKAVWDGINRANNQKENYSFSQMQDFCSAQRLFRLAFEGFFGNDFPIEKLVYLFNEVCSLNDTKATDTWSRYFFKNQLNNDTTFYIYSKIGAVR